ncbi:hypothetical protein DFS34DRAFT_592876 [Phlyctochytrium arcticum]|nr:hypothetical protein DFS34DRAFT_592876 [Phlyctochytrium arcticum]
MQIRTKTLSLMVTWISCRKELGDKDEDAVNGSLLKDLSNAILAVALASAIAPLPELHSGIRPSTDLTAFRRGRQGAIWETLTVINEPLLIGITLSDLGQSIWVRHLQDLIRLTCPERTDEENIAVFLAGNQPPLPEEAIVATTTSRKEIAVHLAAKSDNVSAVAAILRISEKNIYRWRKHYAGTGDVEGSETLVLPTSSEVHPLQELIRLSCPERTDEENIAVFLAGNQPPLPEEAIDATTTSNHQAQLMSNEDLKFWFIEMVDKQLTATLNQVDQVDADANPGKQKKMFLRTQ